MVTVNYNPRGTYVVDKLYQWDINQKLEIRGLSLPSIPEIHFTNDTMDRAIVRQATMTDDGVIIVDVPNSLTQQPYKITAYICIYENEVFNSLCSVTIPIEKCAKPNDYTIEGDVEIYSFNALENKINNVLAESLVRYNNVNSKYEVAEGKYNQAVNTLNESIDNYNRSKDDINNAVENVNKTLTDKTVEIDNALSDNLDEANSKYNLAVNNLNEAKNKYNGSVDVLAEAEEILTESSNKYDEAYNILADNNQLTPLFANSIEECTDTTKLYVLPDGYIYAYMMKTEVVQSYTNLADPTSADWLTDKRFSTSSISDFTGAIITNHIPCKKGDTIRMKGVDVTGIISSAYARTRMFNNGSSVGDTDYYVKTLIDNGYGSFDESTKITTFRLVDMSTGGTLSYDFNTIRQNLKLLSGYTANDVIITVNEEISGDGGSSVITSYKWTNTGHAFTPADYEDRIIEAENSINDLEIQAVDFESRITDLENNEVQVPNYWVEHLKEKANQIQLAMENAGQNKSAFLWYTDAHWANGNSKVSPLLLRYLYENTPMNKINFGGDIVGDPVENTHDAISYVYEWRKMIKNLPNHHSVIGNHDNFHKGRNDSEFKNMVYAFLIAPEETPNMIMGGDLYYYIDNPGEKTRYLYLDSGRYSLTDTETNFIIDALTTTPSGWHVVVISHVWFQYTSASTPSVGSINPYMQKALDLFDAYNNRASGNITMISETLSYDFSNCGGKVEFCIGGHVHIDLDLASTGGIPVIITASDVNQERSSDETEDSGTLGTITESAVGGIIADYDNNIVTVVGVGRMGDRVINLT